MTILAQVASDNVLDSADEWLCRRRRESVPVWRTFATLKKRLGRHAEQDLPDRLEMGAACPDLLRERVHVAEAALERAAREDQLIPRSPT